MFGSLNLTCHFHLCKVLIFFSFFNQGEYVRVTMFFFIKVIKENRYTLVAFIDETRVRMRRNYRDANTKTTLNEIFQF